jgi:hypothetical protein
MSLNVTLRTGDVLLRRPSGIIGHAIAILQWQWPSWRPFSHAAPVWVLGGVPHAVDAEVGGLHANPIEPQVVAGASFMVRKVPEAVRCRVDPGKLVCRAAEWFGQQVDVVTYDYWDLFRLLWRCPLGWRPAKESGVVVRRKIVCSAFTSATLRRLFEYDAVPEHCDRWTTPSDLAATRGLATVTRELRRV